MWASDGSQVISPPSSTLGRRKLPPPEFSSLPGVANDPLQGSSAGLHNTKNLSAPKSPPLLHRSPEGVVLSEFPTGTSQNLRLFPTHPGFHPMSNLQKMFLLPPLPFFSFPSFIPSKGKLTSSQCWPVLSLIQFWVPNWHFRNVG